MKAPQIIKIVSVFILSLSLAVLPVACLEQEKGDQAIPSSAESTQQSEDQYLETIKALYEKAKQSGEQVPDDITQWVTEDVKQIGAWQYFILELPTAENSEIEKRLNELGSKRWECYWVESTEAGKKFYMKKAGRSYLQRASRVIKLFPTGGDGE